MSKKKSRSTKPEGCVFCKSDVKNEFLYGKFHHVEGVSVHQNCLFFSSGLKQNGKESDGILGFLPSDIRTEVIRGQRLKCSYCKKCGATVGCCINKCRKTFHFACGKEHNSLHQHYGSFQSFCSLHKPKQKPMVTAKEEFFCRICFLSLVHDNSDSYLHSPCCKHNWFHRTCLQEYASSAGRYFFKCPLCNNTSEFLKEMLFQGISVPEQDASWEVAENAFQDLLHRPECGAITCYCKRGRKYTGKREWILLPCSICGSQARHQFCAKLDNLVNSWKCDECKYFENKITESKHPEVISKEKDIQPRNSRSVLVFLDDSSESDSSSDSTSLKPITNMIIRNNNSPVISDSIPSAIETKSQANVSNVSNKRKHVEDQQLRDGFKDKTINMPFSSINTSKKHLKGTKKIAKKVETSATISPYVVKCPDAKQPWVINNHLSKKMKKSKNPSSTCCSPSNHCIKKMFGLECRNYRI